MLKRSQVTDADDKRRLMPGQKVKYPAFKDTSVPAHEVYLSGLDMRPHFE